MSRRYTPAPREVLPDPKFHNRRVSLFVHRLMYGGKKSVAQRVLYTAMAEMAERTQKEPIELFESALQNVAPVVEVKPRRVGGATYQVPLEVKPERRETLAMRWIIDAARARAGKSMSEKLANELQDAAGGSGGAMRKREEVHKMAEANRAFSHYRF